MENKKILIVASVLLVLAVITISVALGYQKLMDTPDTGEVARIELNEPIMPGVGGPLSSGGTDPKTIQSLVDQAQRDNVDAFLVELNSPGGSVVASKDVANTISRIEQPVSCLVKEVAVSGAYWVATECDYIVADSLSTVGSIGAMSTYLEFSEFMDEQGIEYVNLTAGEHKLTGSMFQELSDEEREILEGQLDTVHQEFKDQVADERNLTEDEIEDLATGETFLGTDAYEKDLIDDTGDKETSMDYLENETNKTLSVSTYARGESFNILSLLAKRVGEGIGNSLSLEIEGNLGEEPVVFR